MRSTDPTQSPSREQTDQSFIWNQNIGSGIVLKLNGCQKDGVWFRPEVPNEMVITLFTKDGKEWLCKWVEAPTA